MTADEIRRTTQIITASRKRAETRYIFNWITLQEPPKSVLLPYFLSDTDPPFNVAPRRSFTVLIERGNGLVHEVIVNLDTGKVESFTDVAPGLEPSLSPEDMLNAETVARMNDTVQARCADLGYPNMSLVNADAWSMGYVGDKPEFQGKRLIQLYLYGKNSIHDNQYGKYIRCLDFRI